jgi:putative tricarboxylic transport membrane protein
MSAFFGLILASVGMDKVSGRVTCALPCCRGFYDGMPFIPALIGLFAISEVFNNIENILKTRKNGKGGYWQIITRFQCPF